PHVRLRAKEPAVVHDPPAEPDEEAVEPAERRGGKRVSHALEIREVAATPVAPDHLAGMVLRAAPTGELVQVVDDRILDPEVEAKVEGRLLVSEVRAIADCRVRGEVEAGVQPLGVVGRKANGE